MVRLNVELNYLNTIEQQEAELSRLRAEIERLRAALREISEYGYDVENDDAYPLKLIARAALTTTPPPGSAAG